MKYSESARMAVRWRAHDRRQLATGTCKRSPTRAHDRGKTELVALGCRRWGRITWRCRLNTQTDTRFLDTDHDILPREHDPVVVFGLDMSKFVSAIGNSAKRWFLRISRYHLIVFCLRQPRASDHSELLYCRLKHVSDQSRSRSVELRKIHQPASTDICKTLLVAFTNKICQRYTNRLLPNKQGRMQVWRGR